MKNYSKVLILAVTILAFSCKSEVKKVDAIFEITTIEHIDGLDKTIQLIDVRTPEEYKEGYIKHATNINFKDVNFLDLMSVFDKNEPVYVYCMVGGRSGKAASKLKDAGFKIIYDYKGGYKEWKANGKAISMNQ